jgi:large subunit ribosomal protein L3
MPVDGILGKKIGMTQLFREDGRRTSVTAIQAGPCMVTQVRTPARDGYAAVQLGFGEARRLNKPEHGHQKGLGKLFRHLREVPAGELGDVQVGQEVVAGIFAAGERVDITGTSKGHGFTGVVKRHNFRGGPKTHGQSDRNRAPGSIGSTTFAGRVFKGLRMAGHWGNERITVQSLEVVRVEPERHLLFVQGSVPGGSRGLLIIRRSRKVGKK